VSTSEKTARSSASAAVLPTRLDWGIGIAALFILGRWPMLFLRTRLIGVLGPVRWPDWQYDVYIRVIFITVEVVAAIFAARRLRFDGLRRQPFLVAILVLVWASTIWSVEPGVTIWRASTFIGAAAVGWYVGERFTLPQIANIVASVAALGTVASLIAVVVVPKVATTTGGLHAWSGIYYNRNELALILCAGILASGFLLTHAPRRARIPVGIAVLAEVLLLAKTGSRTGPMALGGTVVVCGVVYLVRKYAKGKLSVFWASIFSLGTILMGFSVVEWQWKRILSIVGRNTSLSHRKLIWYYDRLFIAKHPWTGWGFEAIWSNRLTSAEFSDVMGRFPYSSHSGYYEIAAGIGWVGLGVLACFLAFTLYRAFVYAWRGRDVFSLWPLALVLFILAANFTESLFVSSEAFWALIVAVAFALSRTTTILVRRSPL
jgi:exopolysaccharide production protein ExoQ